MTQGPMDMNSCSAGRSGLRMPLNRRGWVLLATFPVGMGLFLNWAWLTAAGVAPILLSVAPCAAMCALGLCMKGGGKTCAHQGQNEAETIPRLNFEDAGAHLTHKRTVQ